MYYIVYKTINLVNNKFYIGKHQQASDPYQFDGYYGSGKLIKTAIKKYGKENFIRETLFVFENESECLLKEEEIVSIHLGQKTCYNMVHGGTGTFKHINAVPKENRPNLMALKRKIAAGEVEVGGTKHWTKETFEKVSETSWGKLIKKGVVNPNTWKGLTESQRKERAEKIAKKLTGNGNGSYGSKCYFNPETNERKRFYPTDVIPEGWIRSTRAKKD